jgi:hypothetical protein
MQYKTLPDHEKTQYCCVRFNKRLFKGDRYAVLRPQLLQNRGILDLCVTGQKDGF